MAAGTGGGKKSKTKKPPASSSSDPLGVDLLRLWVGSSDYSGDVSIGKSVLSKMSEAMKKLRHSAKFMLGVLDDFTPADMVPYAQLSKIDQYVLHTMQLYAHDVTQAYDAYAFKEVISLLLQFNSQTLSAFVFDLSKDRFYADASSSPSRRAAQTVLLHALITFTKSVAPILPHFAEDIYQHVPAAIKPCFRGQTDQHTQTHSTGVMPLDSVFVHGWLSPSPSSVSSMSPSPSPSWTNPSVYASVSSARRVRSHVTELLERIRQNKKIANFTEAKVSKQQHMHTQAQTHSNDGGACVDFSAGLFSLVSSRVLCVGVRVSPRRFVVVSRVGLTRRRCDRHTQRATRRERKDTLCTRPHRNGCCVVCV